MSNNGRRTRNAQAQASLRLRRKAYIKSLEDTVSSLEVCVRKYLNNPFSCSTLSNGATLILNGVGGEMEELKRENQKLKMLLAEANLALINAVKGGKLGKDSPLLMADEKGKKGDNKDRGDVEENWTKTTSITAKKRKLSSVQAFALDLVADSTTLPTTASTSMVLPNTIINPSNNTTSTNPTFSSPQTPPSIPHLPSYLNLESTSEAQNKPLSPLPSQNFYPNQQLIPHQNQVLLTSTTAPSYQPNLIWNSGENSSASIRFRPPPIPPIPPLLKKKELGNPSLTISFYHPPLLFVFFLVMDNRWVSILDKVLAREISKSLTCYGSDKVIECCVI